MTPEELRARREALGLSQSDLARPLGVPPLTVWKWEHARQKAPAIMDMALRGVEATLQTDRQRARARRATRGRRDAR